MEKFKAGDLVVVIVDNSCYFYKGDIAIVEEYDNDDDTILLNFNCQGNNEVLNDGYCWSCDNELKHYTPVEDLPLWKSNHMYLKDEQQQALRKLLHRVQWDEEYAEKIRFSRVSSDTIVDAFTWEYTEEGQEFWESVNDQCYNEETQQPDEIRSRATGKVIEPLGVDPISCGKITVGGVSSALATQEGGSHYKKCGIQPVEYIQANNLDYFQGNVIKYTTRHKDKSGVEDIKKAIHYLQLILELQYNK